MLCAQLVVRMHSIESLAWPPVKTVNIGEGRGRCCWIAGFCVRRKWETIEGKKFHKRKEKERIVEKKRIEWKKDSCCRVHTESTLMLHTHTYICS